MRICSSVLLALGLLGTASGVARADPRWWQDEVPVSGPNAADLDLDVVPGTPPLVFIAWVESDPVIEGWVHLTASFDGGCTFCDPIPVASAVNGDVEVALAVAELQPGIVASRDLSIQVLRAQAGELQAYHARIQVDPAAPPAQACETLALATWQADTLSRAGADQPDIAGESHGGGFEWTTHFHAVWRQSPASGPAAIDYARDLSGLGSGWEVLGSVSGTDPPTTSVRDPQVSVDFLQGGSAGTSAVNVAFAEESWAQVWYLRSTDSGTTFSASGAPPASPPAPVFEGATNWGGAGPFALDSGVGAPTDAAAPLWHAVFGRQEWQLGMRIKADAQRNDTPSTAAPAWGTDVSPAGGGGPVWLTTFAASVFSGDPAPVFLFWKPMVEDLVYRGGVLDSKAATPVDLDRFPIPAARATDPVASETTQLTSCDYDEATGGCTSSRTAGAARSPVSDEAGGDVFVAWVDDRSGSPTVWFKRTDREVAPPDPSLETSCPAQGVARITVRFPQLAHCGFDRPAMEKLLRYRVYWGTTPGGPYPDSKELLDDGTLPDPVVVDLDGLAPATTYHVIVVPEDEARNVYPADFDPLQTRPVPPVNERSVTTPPVCGDRCLYRAEAPGRDVSGLFLAPPRPADDVAFAPPNDTVYICPFSSGEADPDPVLERGPEDLVFWQVDGADVRDLTVRADQSLRSVRITY